MRFPIILSLGLSAVAVMIGLSVVWLPAPLSSSAPASKFSAERAWRHVNIIAQKPHPAGSQENIRVRTYLESELSSLGLVVRVLPANHGQLRLANIYGELAGTDGVRPCILLVSHYDSVTGGPGAADCASGVATLLETLRAIRAGPHLGNSVAVLFTDGEELGMAGAKAFIRDHPELWRDIRVILNLEARGNQGPVIMFETSPGAGMLITLLSKQCPYPIACSYSREIYRRLPNDTDFTEFLEAGRAGMNFSFIGGLEYYHSPNDTPENLSRRTLQHYGSYLLPLTIAMGQAALVELDQATNSAEATYFPLSRGLLVRYPQKIGTALPWLTLFLFALAVMRQRKLLRPGRIIGGLIIGFLAIVLSAGLSFLTLKLLRWAHNPAGKGLFIVGLPFEEAYLLLLVFGAAAITLGLNAWLLRRLHPEERLVCALLPWFGFMVVTEWYAPGAAYVFLWPTILGILAMLLPAGKTGTPNTFLRRALTAMPAPLLLAPALFLLNQAVTIGIAPFSAALAAIAFNLACAPGFRADSAP